jgi:hypothetical protein
MLESCHERVNELSRFCRAGAWHRVGPLPLGTFGLKERAWGWTYGSHTLPVPGLKAKARPVPGWMDLGLLLV